MEDVSCIGKRKKKPRGVGEPHPWEPRHMKLRGRRLAESAGGLAGSLADRRNVTLGVIQHLWRSPVPFLGFYPPEGVLVTESRFYFPTSPRMVDDSEYLAGVEAHKREFARGLEEEMVHSGNLPGYFEVPTDEGWRVVLDLPGSRLEMADAWGLCTGSEMVGDLAPFVWAYRNSGFCMVTVYDKDIEAVRDDLLFVAKRKGVELRWSRTAA